jgi:hypothetical protein
MQSTPNLRDTDPHDVFVIEPDAARADKAPLNLLYDVLSRPSDPVPSQVRPDPELRIAPDFSASAAVPSVDAAARATVAAEVPVKDIRLGETEISAHRSPAGKLARGAVMGLFALVSATGAAAWQHYGDDAKAMLAQYAPTFSLASLASTAKPATTEAAPATQAAADQVAAAPSASAPSAANAPAAMASVANEQAQQLQSMARDLAAMGQQISDLKATIEQLRTSQAQMPQAQAPLTQAQVTSTPAKTTEARLTEPALTRHRIVPPPTHSTVTSLARRPKQTFPYAPIAPASPPPQAPQAVAAAPVQTAPQVQAAEAPDGGPVVRPPMPLR